MTERSHDTSCESESTGTFRGSGVYDTVVVGTLVDEAPQQLSAWYTCFLSPQVAPPEIESGGDGEDGDVASEIPACVTRTNKISTL